MKGLLLRNIYEIIRPKNLLLILCFLGFELLTVGLSFLNPQMEEDTSSCWMTAIIVNFCLMFITFNTLMEDEKCRWNVYCVNTAMGRRGFAAAQYVSAVFFCAVTSLIALIYPLVMVLVGNRFDISEILLGYVTLFCISMLISAVELPLMLRFGSNPMAAMIVMMAIIMVGGGTLMTLTGEEALFRLAELTVKYNKLLLALLELLLTGVLVFLSLLLSLRLFSRREL